MKILVLVKQVPDTWSNRQIDSATHRVDRVASDRVVDEINERGVELALRHREAGNDVEIVVATMGPANAVDALRKCLSMGADEGILVTDSALEGADALTTSKVLAAVVEKVQPDLVVAGNLSTDGLGGVVPPMVADFLGWPLLASADQLDLSPSDINAEKSDALGTTRIHAELPAVVTLTERAPEGRFPSFKGIMSAKKKPVHTWSLSDVAVSSTDPLSVVFESSPRPARTAGRVVVDEGQAAQELVEYLKSNRLI